MIIVLSILLILIQVVCPKRIAFAPLLIALIHLGNVSLFSDFTPIRLIIVAGIIRGFIDGSSKRLSFNNIDKLFFLFGAFAILSTFGHEANEYVKSPFKERVGLIMNVVGGYFYARMCCESIFDLTTLSKILALVLIPFSLLLAVEQLTGRNCYSTLGLGARSEIAAMRNDQFRAKGPFGHAILAGTVAAAAFPFMVLLRRRHRILGFLGILASILGAVSSASSGPLAAMIVAIGLIMFWNYRYHLKLAKRILLLTLIFLNFAMTKPIWFLIAKIDIVGGSTGYHRSKLIDTAMKDLGSWWLAGTDHTRHWMFSGVAWNPNHTDITNYYLQFGVLGGLPLMLTFIVIIFKSLGMLEKAMVKLRAAGDGREFDAWCVWTAIITHAVSFLSIAYFDQSYAGFFLLIGAVPAIAAWAAALSPAATAGGVGSRTVPRRAERLQSA